MMSNLFWETDVVGKEFSVFSSVEQKNHASPSYRGGV